MGLTTPGLHVCLAKSIHAILPSSMHTLWAGSNSYHLSELNTIQGGVASPCLSSSLPFCVRFNRALPLEIQLYSQAATHDTKPLAKSYLDGSHSHLPSNHFQYARASHGSSISDIHPPSNSSSRTIRMFFTAFMIAR